MDAAETLDKTERRDYTVEPFEEDFSGRLSWSVLGRKILATAGVHADRRGFGIKQLLPDGYSWVLARLKIEMGKMPRLGDSYRVETWIRSIYHTFTDRCFAVVNPSSGEAYGYAFSTWAMIDVNTRQARNLETLPDGGFMRWRDETKACPVSLFRPVKLREDCDPEVREITALYSDLDVNCHVNSIRYIEHILDLFPPSMYRENDVRSVEMYYRDEARYGDRLRLFRKKEDEGIYAVKVDKVSQTGSGDKVTAACMSRVTFANNKGK